MEHQVDPQAGERQRRRFKPNKALRFENTSDPFALLCSATNNKDHRFAITQLCEGSGSPVLLAKGFLSENGSSWGGYQRLITERYPDSPVFRVSWKALTKPDIIWLITQGHNPWTRARKGATHTGIALAELIKATNMTNFVLVGFSLGARVMAYATDCLAEWSNIPRLETVHLMGAAIRRGDHWRSLSEAVSGTIYNYYSKNDPVLRWAYGATQGFQHKAVGLKGFKIEGTNIEDVDCSNFIFEHQDYKKRLELC